MTCSLRLAAILGVVLAAPVALAERAAISGMGRIVDGDTLDVGAVRIRLHGIDAPEAGQACQRANGKSWQCGTEATNRLAELAEGKPVECEARDRDQYGRIVAVCRQSGIDINEIMVGEGLAWAFVRFSDDYVIQEASARAARVGIWQGPAELPWEYRENRWERAAEASPRPGCPIKGNINRQGERIYHTPWSPWYGRTQINENQGERWFCDEAEALEAGWRAPYWR